MSEMRSMASMALTGRGAENMASSKSELYMSVRKRADERLKSSSATTTWRCTCSQRMKGRCLGSLLRTMARRYQTMTTTLSTPATHVSTKALVRTALQSWRCVDICVMKVKSLKVSPTPR